MKIIFYDGSLEQINVPEVLDTQFANSEYVFDNYIIQHLIDAGMGWAHNLQTYEKLKQEEKETGKEITVLTNSLVILDEMIDDDIMLLVNPKGWYEIKHVSVKDFCCDIGLVPKWRIDSDEIIWG